MPREYALAKVRERDLIGDWTVVHPRRKSKAKDKKKESLLDQRRREYSIPMWPGQAMYGRIIVYRIPDKAAERKKYNEGGIIEMIDDVADNKKWHAPRGVIVSAGLLAMDILRGNAIGLGDMIWMASHTPWRFEVDSEVKNGKVESTEFFFMQAGDVVLAEDLFEKVKAGTVLPVLGATGKHHYEVDGESIPRFDPPEHADDM